MSFLSGRPGGEGGVPLLYMFTSWAKILEDDKMPNSVLYKGVSTVTDLSVNEEEVVGEIGAREFSEGSETLLLCSAGCLERVGR